MISRVFGMTDVGRRRENNQDQFLVDEGRGVFAVADGMGGHAAGEVASGLAIDALAESIAEVPDAQPARNSEEAVRQLRAAFQRGNQSICDSVVARGEWRGMGTTIVALVMLGGEVVIGHVGDSRAYRLRDGRLERLTDDHSWVSQQVKLGLLTSDEASRHPMRNIVTRALGNRAELEVDFAVEKIRPGDVYLLCSDGLNSMMADGEIESTLIEHAKSPETSCAELIRKANELGGDDNISVIVVLVEEEPQTG